MFNDPSTTELYTLSLHDALPIWLHRAGPPSGAARILAVRRSDRGARLRRRRGRVRGMDRQGAASLVRRGFRRRGRERDDRSEEHTSELQSLRHLVCRLLLEKKKE